MNKCSYTTIRQKGKKALPSYRPGTSHWKFIRENQAAITLHKPKKLIKTETGRWHYKSHDQAQEPDQVNCVLAFEKQIKAISRKIQAAFEH